MQNTADTLLTVGVTNTGAAQNINFSVSTGNVYDPQLALPAGCVPADAGATVNCTAGYGPGQAKSFDIAVKTPATGTSITSTVAAVGSVGGSDSASIDTAMSGDAVSFSPGGDCQSSVDPNTVTNFCVPVGSAPGLFIDLNEVILPEGTACTGTAKCKREAAEALFPNSGYYSGSDPNHPFLWDISYGKLTCNGAGAPKCTDVLFYIASGTSSPVKMQKCLTFGLGTAKLLNVNQVCLQNAVKSGDSWTFTVALLRDIVIPIIGGLAIAT